MRYSGVEVPGRATKNTIMVVFKEGKVTKKEILAMKAGRQLDGLVGKEVMGIKVEYPFAEGCPYYLREDEDKKMKWDIVPFYSTDTVAAWQVVDKVIDGHGFELYTATEYAQGKWFAHFYGLARAEADTATEAISKAALLAKLGYKD